MHKSVLKPIGAPYTNKTVDTDKGIVSTVTIEPATEPEIADTIAVMGGEDWELWMQALPGAGLLAPGRPERRLFLHRARGHLGDLQERHDRDRQERSGAGRPVIDADLQRQGGRAFISVNKALVTQASSAIPVVPLYISILYKLMKANGTHEGCIEQMQRLFASQLYAPGGPKFDSGGRVRVDDLEMRPGVQEEVKAIWPTVTTENLAAATDIAGYREEFLKLFGFGLAGVDYEAEAEPHVPML